MILCGFKLVYFVFQIGIKTLKPSKKIRLKNCFSVEHQLEFATSLLFFSKGDKVQNILHNIKYNEQKELAIFIGKIFGERLQNNSSYK
jgi:hypothetical protein